MDILTGPAEILFHSHVVDSIHTGEIVVVFIYCFIVLLVYMKVRKGA